MRSGQCRGRTGQYLSFFPARRSLPTALHSEITALPTITPRGSASITPGSIIFTCSASSIIQSGGESPGNSRDQIPFPPAHCLLPASLYAICAQIEGRVVGCGRVIGDGGLHLYLTDVIVNPAHQRRGIGTKLVAALTRYVESVPYVNTIVAVLPTPGLVEFYAMHGYKPLSSSSPIMQRWINRSGG